VATQAAFLFVYAVTSAAIPRQIASHARSRASDHWSSQLFTSAAGRQRHANSISDTATTMTTSAMKITAPAFDMRHIAHRQCPSP